MGSKVSEPTLRQYEIEWIGMIDQIEAVSEADVVRIMSAEIPALVREHLAPQVDELGNPIVIHDVRVYYKGIRRKTPVNGAGFYIIDELTIFVYFEGYFTEAASPLPPLVILLILALIAATPLIIKGLIIIGIGIIVVQIFCAIRDITTREHIKEEVYDEYGNLLYSKEYSREPAIEAWIPIVIIVAVLGVTAIIVGPPLIERYLKK